MLMFPQTDPLKAPPLKGSPSPQPAITRRHQKYPFTENKSPQLPETAEIKLLPDQNFTIEIPQRILGHQEICSLIQAAALMISDASTAKEEELYRKAFHKGLAAAASICKLPPQSLSNTDALRGQPAFSTMMP